MGKIAGKVHGREIRAQAGFIVTPLLLKVIAGVVLAIAVAWVVHTYNEGLREDGREEVRAEWTKATAAQTAAWEADRKKLEGEKTAISKKYQAERTARTAAEQAADREREDAIANSSVARNECFDERMRDNWNRDSGHPSSGKTGGSVAPKVPGPAK